MRPIWKGTISFGLVNIPIALGVATQRSDPRFRTLDAETLHPIRQQLYSPERDAVVDREETVKGYEVSKDRYVVVTDEEIESVQRERRRTIDIIAFVDEDEVDPVYYDRTYYLAPQPTAEKPYALLLEAMRNTGKAGLGKLVLSSKEHLVLLRPAGDSLVVELLFYPEDVRSKVEIEEAVREADVAKAELEMAERLVEQLSGPFEPERFENEHKRDLLALIERKSAGEEIEITPETPAPKPVPDLMAALKASLDASGDGGEPGAKPKRKAAASSNGKAKKAKSTKAAAKPKASTKSGARKRTAAKR